MPKNIINFKDLENKELPLHEIPEVTKEALDFQQQLEVMENWMLGRITSDDENVKRKRLSLATVKGTKGCICSLYNKMAGIELTRSWINAALSKLEAEGMPARSINAYEFAIERFFRANLHNDKFIVPKRDYIIPEAKFHTLEEIHMILAGCKNIRDKAILAVLYYCAPRVGEFCNLKMKDLDMANRLLTINSTKQHRQRTVPIAEEAMPIINQWLEFRESVNITNEYLFLNIQGTKFTNAGVYKLVLKYAKKVGLVSHPHTFRHSRANHLLYIYHWPIELVAKFIGDSLAITYEVYSHTSINDMQKQMNVSD